MFSTVYTNVEARRAPLKNLRTEPPGDILAQIQRIVVSIVTFCERDRGGYDVSIRNYYESLKLISWFLQCVESSRCSRGALAVFWRCGSS